jgi:hypothetical protein
MYFGIHTFDVIDVSGWVMRRSPGRTGGVWGVGAAIRNPARRTCSGRRESILQFRKRTHGTANRVQWVGVLLWFGIFGFHDRCFWFPSAVY